MQSELDAIATAAIAQWIEVLDGGDPRLAMLGDVHFVIADLDKDELGHTSGNMIVIDADAAGYGWFVDTTLGDIDPDANNTEFTDTGNNGSLTAQVGSPAVGKQDLLT